MNNYYQIIRDSLQPLLDRLIERPETQGVCILGSFAKSGIRPNVDNYSDFDIALFIDLSLEPKILELESLKFQNEIQEYLPTWLPNFKFIYPFNDIYSAKNSIDLQINIHQLVLNYEEQPRIIWPADRREAFANTCDIIYDPSFRVKELIRQKSQPSESEITSRIYNHLAIIPITIEHSLEKATARGALADACLTLAALIDQIIDFAYALNSRDLPHRKWRVKMLNILDKLPLEFQSRIEKLLITSSENVELLNNKIIEIKKLFTELHSIARQAGYNMKDPYQRLVTEVFPGFQLAKNSLADKEVGNNREQYEKMKDSKWNLINFKLFVNCK